MELAVQRLGITYTDEQINQLAQRHFENMEVLIIIISLHCLATNVFEMFVKETYPCNFQLVGSKWASELSNIKDTQKREYREWVMRVHEDTQATEATPTYM